MIPACDRRSEGDAENDRFLRGQSEHNKLEELGKKYNVD